MLMPDSQSSTLAVGDPVTRRITGLLRGMANMYSQWQNRDKDFLIRQIRIILDAIIEEVEEDDKQIFASQSAQLMVLNFSKLLEFCVTGDMSSLPPEIIPIACQIEGIEYVPTQAPDETQESLLALPASAAAPDAE